MKKRFRYNELVYFKDGVGNLHYYKVIKNFGTYGRCIETDKNGKVIGKLPDKIFWRGGGGNPNGQPEVKRVEETKMSKVGKLLESTDKIDIFFFSVNFDDMYAYSHEFSNVNKNDKLDEFIEKYYDDITAIYKSKKIDLSDLEMEASAEQGYKWNQEQFIDQVTEAINIIRKEVSKKIKEEDMGLCKLYFDTYVKFVNNHIKTDIEQMYDDGLSEYEDEIR